MEKTETHTFPDSLIIPPHYAIIATLLVLLDRSGLTNAVINHCKMGLMVLVIICDNRDYNTGTDLLSGKEFDAFFKSFPATYFKHRDLIPANIIFKSVELSFKTNTIEHVVW